MAYDSDQESIDLNELHGGGLKPQDDAKASSQLFGFDALNDAECAQAQTEGKLEAIEKEMQLFTLDETEGTKLPFLDVKDKQAELQPPPIPFFTSNPCEIYLPETLLWPFKDSKDVLSNMDFHDIEMKIKEGYFLRQFLSKRKLLYLYLFHLMISTKDVTLIHCTFRTLLHMMHGCSLYFNMFDDIFLALANLGADISKFGQTPSKLKSPVIQFSKDIKNEKDKLHGTFKENKILILKFLSAHLEKSKKYSAEELNILLKTVLAIGMDPLIMDSGTYIYIQNICNHILNLFPSNELFEKEVLPDVVKRMIDYYNFHHSVAYVCSSYLTPTQKRGQIFRSAMAYLQAEISLEKDHQKSDLDDIKVEDVLNLVVERKEVFKNESESYLLRSVLILLDSCISDDPLPAHQRAKLQELCDIIEPIVKKRKICFEDHNSQHLNHLIHQLMIKWRQKAGHVKRQQTLLELRDNFHALPTINQSSGPQMSVNDSEMK